MIVTVITYGVLVPVNMQHACSQAHTSLCVTWNTETLDFSIKVPPDGKSQYQSVLVDVLRQNKQIFCLSG